MASRPAPPAAAKPKLAVTGKPVGTSKPGDAGASKSGLSPAAERMKFCADVLAGYKVEVQVRTG